MTKFSNHCCSCKLLVVSWCSKLATSTAVARGLHCEASSACSLYDGHTDSRLLVPRLAAAARVALGAAEVGGNGRAAAPKAIPAARAKATPPCTYSPPFEHSRRRRWRWRWRRGPRRTAPLQSALPYCYALFVLCSFIYLPTTLLVEFFFAFYTNRIVDICTKNV